MSYACSIAIDNPSSSSPSPSSFQLKSQRKSKKKNKEIKGDVEKHVQGNDDLTTNSSEISCKTSEMDHASDEIEDKEIEILSMVLLV